MMGHPKSMQDWAAHMARRDEQEGDGAALICASVIVSVVVFVPVLLGVL